MEFAELTKQKNKRWAESLSIILSFSVIANGQDCQRLWEGGFRIDAIDYATSYFHTARLLAETFFFALFIDKIRSRSLKWRIGNRTHFSNVVFSFFFFPEIGSVYGNESFPLNYSIKKRPSNPQATGTLSYRFLPLFSSSSLLEKKFKSSYWTNLKIAFPKSLSCNWQCCTYIQIEMSFFFCIISLRSSMTYILRHRLSCRNQDMSTNVS
jgi:hypothetical protein